MHGKTNPPSGHHKGSNPSAIHKPDPAARISQAITHELDNIFATVQTYADRLALKHWEDPALALDLKLISESARHTFTLVRNALNQKIQVRHFHKRPPHSAQSGDPARTDD